MIESYSFGSITIAGTTYTSDVIIYKDRIDSRWWRKQGHQLASADIEGVIEEQPEVLVVGTGDAGMVSVLPETKKLLKEKGIELIAKKTRQACAAYNDLLSKGRNVIAALHLTC